MSQPSLIRRLLLAGAVLSASLLLGLFLLRTAMVGFAAGFALHGLGANDVSYRVTHATPWHVAIEDVKYRVGSHPWSIRRVEFERAHWWSLSLGTLRIEGLETPVKVEELIGAAVPAASTPPPPAVRSAPEVPLDGVSVDGRLLLQLNGQPDQPLTVTLSARPQTATLWQGETGVLAPGLEINAALRCDFTRGSVHFEIPAFHADLQAWPGLVGQLAPGWELTGRVEGSAEGDWLDGKLAGRGHVALHEGRAVETKPAVAAEGIEAGMDLTDLAKIGTGPGTLRIATVKVGQLELRDVDVAFASESLERIKVTRAGFSALGGKLSAEPFVFQPARADLDAVLNVDGVDVEQVLALTKDLPASATGRVSGRFPVRIAGDGFQFGTGWLGLKPGVAAEVRFKANGLLTSGLSDKSPAYGVLQQVESGLLKLKVNELRLDIHPPGAPPERSAQLHLAGEPVDPTVKAPVTLDLNVNGPLEKLLNLGMDSRLSFGAAK
ncbi:MAG TPA: YdbH domain-containing protein [Lacunisphaera sp.]|nr:YdbH domain-containing protein [Lacunisphaera sp.]